MQTFLPHADFEETARCLDRQRLGCQRKEAKQILSTIAKGDGAKGWANHPAVKMWRGYEAALIHYGLAICQEWVRRGYRDAQAEILRGFTEVFNGPPVNPPWLGDEAFHRAHQSNLKRKNPEHYGPLWPDVPDDLPYMWPAGARS